MTSAETAAAARKLLAHDAAWGLSARRIASCAEERCENLSRHLAWVPGETASRALFHRSLVLTRARMPWLADVAGLAVEVYAELLSTFVQLLGRLVGTPLVSRLLQEIWPKFPHAVVVKEPS